MMKTTVVEPNPLFGRALWYGEPFPDAIVAGAALPERYVLKA